MKGAGAESSKVWMAKCYSLRLPFFSSPFLLSVSPLSCFPSLCSSSANLWLIWASGGAAHWGKWDPVKTERRLESPEQRESEKESLPFTMTLALTSVEAARNQTPLPSPAWVICVWLHAAQSTVFSHHILFLLAKKMSCWCKTMVAKILITASQLGLSSPIFFYIYSGIKIYDSVSSCMTRASACAYALTEESLELLNNYMIHMKVLHVILDTSHFVSHIFHICFIFTLMFFFPQFLFRMWFLNTILLICHFFHDSFILHVIFPHDSFTFTCKFKPRCNQYYYTCFHMDVHQLKPA